MKLLTFFVLACLSLPAFAADAAKPNIILIISDDGVTTMFDADEKGNSGWEISAAALSQAGGGGTMVLYRAKEKGRNRYAMTAVQ